MKTTEHVVNTERVKYLEGDIRADLQVFEEEHLSVLTLSVFYKPSDCPAARI